MTEKEVKNPTLTELYKLRAILTEESKSAEQVERKPKPTLKRTRKRTDRNLVSEELKRELERVKRRSSKRQTLWNLITVMAVTSALVVLITTYFFPIIKVSGTSMDPTLKNGDLVITLKSTKVEPGDLCYFYSGHQILCKRVIAVAADVVDIDADGNVIVNGFVLDEPYLAAKAKGECDIELPFVVPENTYFVMGDNREMSVDSRHTEVGCISEEDISGVVLFRLWPFYRVNETN